MKNISLIFVLMALLTACTQMTSVNSSVVSPIKAIELSAASAPENLKGIFEFKVKSTDSEQRLEFLNSEIDHLDQRNLTIALRPNAVKELTQKYGDNPKVFLLDKNIRVKGEAKRIKKWVLYKNKNTKQYYYQTKIFVKSANQLTVL
jgi:hypothetical protein